MTRALLSRLRRPARVREPRPGTVYLLVSCRHAGVVKIGHTGRLTADRTRELEAAPGYRGFAPFTLVETWAAPDARALETAAHRRLRARRVRLRVGARELFRVTPEAAVRAVEAAAADLGRPSVRPLPWRALAAAAALLLLLLLAAGLAAGAPLPSLTGAGR
ncbi:GIY-YIG nuclease family protein [Roseicella aquatilis]|uniref:Bacteriophage T5 Orf172 DNA-binding domain-containing protein n=1 Tax=Roseicella aquatilis TaxID=2527868 RepID=A0A4R4DKI5_9PROT|nr:GIY-YIG nuclease family protein [Roseicella aquatilis]TCZ61139.1 hypothetical protein EXY23_13500 [Roseicella aquatilis]